MQGVEKGQEALFRTLPLQELLALDHPLRKIRSDFDVACGNLKRPFETSYGTTGNMSSIDMPSEKIFLTEKGRTEDNWGWCYFSSWEWDWVNYVGYNHTTGTIARDGDEVAEKWDCDGLGTGGAVWAGCGMHPRYRFTKTGNQSFGDGHVKAMPKGSIQWFKNIFVKGVGDFQRNGNDAWYPY